LSHPPVRQTHKQKHKLSLADVIKRNNLQEYYLDNKSVLKLEDMCTLSRGKSAPTP